jgi:hypothetical protein
MYTVQQVFDLAMDLINKRLTNGQIAPNTAQYKARTPGILTLWQSENMKSGDLFKTYEISNKPITSMFGNFSGFDYLEYAGQDIIKEANGSAKAYYFEVDGEGTVYIEDFNGTWNTLATINVPNSVEDFEAYKGVVTPSSGATKSRIRFTGQYRYLITNYALFSVPVAPSKVPDYRPWIKKEMPSVFKSLDSVIEEYPQRQYAKSNNYKWEGRKDLYINYYYEGSIRVVYKPVPIQITSMDQTLEVDEISCMSGAYFLATHLLLVEDPDSSNFFSQRYMEMKLENNIRQPATIEQIIDVYGVK